MGQALDSELLLHRWHILRQELDHAGVRLLAVSKYASDEAVSCLVKAGQKEFAESRPQALRNRARVWPACAWHMIGPVQKNKAKYIGRHASMWHSVEDAETAEQVARHVEDRVLPVLLQVNMTGNPRQHGVAPDKAIRLFEQVSSMKQLQVKGLMCMASRDADARTAFRHLWCLRDELFGGSLGSLCMGMSGDYRIAIEEGATIVRLGTALFGDRDT
ncbi:MAG: YggS family pyridoxal phosphate-dependent enzyme [Mariprofundaceae bacterium]